MLFSWLEPKAHKASLKSLSSSVHTFEQKNLQNQSANLSQILSVAFFGWGKGYIGFRGRSDKKRWLPWQKKAPIDI